MRSAKNDRESKGISVSEMVAEGVAHASPDLEKGKIVGPRGLAPKMVDEPSGPSIAREVSSPPNSKLAVPNPEVRARRRRLTRGYKLSILKQAERLKTRPGAIGELLRQEGLYSSSLVEWRKQRDQGLLGQTRGPRPKPPEVAEVAQLKKTISKLEDKNRQFRLVIEAQKKISEILGIRQDNVPPMLEDDRDE